MIDQKTAVIIAISLTVLLWIVFCPLVIYKTLIFWRHRSNDYNAKRKPAIVMLFAGNAFFDSFFSRPFVAFTDILFTIPENTTDNWLFSAQCAKLLTWIFFGIALLFLARLWLTFYSFKRNQHILSLKWKSKFIPEQEQLQVPWSIKYQNVIGNPKSIAIAVVIALCIALVLIGLASMHDNFEEWVVFRLISISITILFFVPVLVMFVICFTIKDSIGIRVELIQLTLFGMCVGLTFGVVTIFLPTGYEKSLLRLFVFPLLTMFVLLRMLIPVHRNVAFAWLSLSPRKANSASKSVFSAGIIIQRPGPAHTFMKLVSSELERVASIGSSHRETTADTGTDHSRNDDGSHHTVQHQTRNEMAMTLTFRDDRSAEHDSKEDEDEGEGDRDGDAGHGDYDGDMLEEDMDRDASVEITRTATATACTNANTDADANADANTSLKLNNSSEHQLSPRKYNAAATRMSASALVSQSTDASPSPMSTSDVSGNRSDDDCNANAAAAANSHSNLMLKHMSSHTSVDSDHDMHIPIAVTTATLATKSSSHNHNHGERKRKSRSRRKSSITLNKLLQNTDGFESFANYLVFEYSVENIFYLLDFKQLQNDLVRNEFLTATEQQKLWRVAIADRILKNVCKAHDSIAECFEYMQYIMTQYIDNYAISQINISYHTQAALVEQMKEYENIHGNDVEIKRDVMHNIYQLFQAAGREIYSLLSSDSFYRFSQTQAFEEWKIAQDFQEIKKVN